MNKARLETTAQIVKMLGEFDGYNDSVKETESMLNNLTDKEFHDFMVKLREGKEYLPYILPTMGSAKITVDKNLKIAKKYGVELFQQLWLTDSATGEVYLTPKKYLVFHLPFRRQQQHLLKKISIPDSSNVVNEMTGQVTGPSKGSSLSFPEMQILYSQGMYESIRELFKFRGGDENNHRTLLRNILSSGDASMSNADDGISRPKSTDVASVMFKTAHLDNNL